MKDIVQSLADFIKASHTWFAYGYANAFFDKAEGMVLHDLGNGEYESLAFQDNIGSYFYIRHNGRMSYGSADRIAGCLASVKKTMSCTLVALLQDGDTFKLEQCLLNSIITWHNKSFVAIPASSIIDTFEVIDAEISNEEAAERAMGNIGSHALVAITFNITGDYHTNSPSCPCNPCNSGQCP